MDIIELDKVSVYHGDTLALREISFSLHCGTLLAVLGPNGAGKSTLLQAILGWLPLRRGRVRIGDEHPQHALPRLTYLPQESRIDLDFPVRVHDVVAQGRLARLAWWRLFGEQDQNLVERAMAEMGITELAHRQIRQLSHGQRQRMFLARAIASGADIFLLDEPFASLDPEAREDLAKLFSDWRAQGRTVLCVMHDIPLARRYFDQVLLLRNETVAFGSCRDVLEPARLRSIFGPAWHGMETESAHA